MAAVVDLRARLADIRRLEAILGEVAGRGACHHPDGAIGMIGSVMTAFAADLRAHLVGSGCRHLGDASFFPAPAEADSCGPTDADAIAPVDSESIRCGVRLSAFACTSRRR